MNRAIHILVAILFGAAFGSWFAGGSNVAHSLYAVAAGIVILIFMSVRAGISRRRENAQREMISHRLEAMTTHITGEFNLSHGHAKRAKQDSGLGERG